MQVSRRQAKTSFFFAKRIHAVALNRSTLLSCFGVILKNSSPAFLVMGLPSLAVTLR